MKHLTRARVRAQPQPQPQLQPPPKRERRLGMDIGSAGKGILTRGEARWWVGGWLGQEGWLGKGGNTVTARVHCKARKK